jgi:short/branched chain acyl-CoA dehydrogenase
MIRTTARLRAGLLRAPRPRHFSTALASEAPSSMVTPTPVTHLLEEEAMMRDATAQWAKEVLAPLVRQMDDAGKMEPHIIQGCLENGFMGVEVAEEYRGCGSSFTSALLVVEELAKVDPSVSVMVDIHNTIVNNCFTYWASERLQAKWLPRLTTDCLGAFCLSEASSGSDAFALRATATRDGDDYVLHGEKMWISNSQEAGVFLVMANADPAAGYRGITCFVVPADAPGLSVGRREDKLGIRASSTCPVRLDGVRVPADDVLGQVGQGYKYAINILNEGRIGIGAPLVQSALSPRLETATHLPPWAT